MDKMQLDRELLEKYVSDGMTQTEIANRLYVSQQTVSEYMKIHGVKARVGKRSACDVELLKKYMLAGMIDEDIARRFGVCTSTVRNWIRKHNLRGIKETVPEKRCRTCKYRDLRKYAGTCDYLSQMHHSRGCPVLGCVVYEKGEPIDKRKRRKKKKCIV